MTSRVVVLRRVRRATYLRVRSSPLMRVNTIRHRAWLAWRLPPGLSRKRCWVLPDDAGKGATPQRCANAASLLSRCGLSPAATNRIAAVCDADAVDLEQARRGAAHERVEYSVETLSVGFERDDATSQRRDRELRRVHDGVAAGGGSQRRRGARQTGHGGTSRSRSRSSSGAVKPRWRI